MIRVLFVCGVLLPIFGCGASAKVSGRVTCQGKPVAGSILFSPKGEDPKNTGPAVNAALKEDGTYEVHLKSLGKHTVVVTPRDIQYPVPPGQFDYPCERTPVERDIQAGEN